MGAPPSKSPPQAEAVGSCLSQNYGRAQLPTSPQISGCPQPTTRELADSSSEASFVSGGSHADPQSVSKKCVQNQIMTQVTSYDSLFNLVHSGLHSVLTLQQNSYFKIQIPRSHPQKSVFSMSQRGAQESPCFTSTPRFLGEALLKPYQTGKYVQTFLSMAQHSTEPRRVGHSPGSHTRYTKEVTHKK